MAKNFLQLFSPEAKWCCPEAKGWCPSGKSIEFFFSNEERSSSERKKTQWTFLKDTILLLKDNIILLKEKTNGKSFLPSRSSSSLYNHEANNINWFYFSILSIIPTPIQYFLLPRPKAFFLLGFQLISGHPLINFSLTSIKPWLKRQALTVCAGSGLNCLPGWDQAYAVSITAPDF